MQEIEIENQLLKQENEQFISNNDHMEATNIINKTSKTQNDIMIHELQTNYNKVPEIVVKPTKMVEENFIQQQQLQESSYIQHLEQFVQQTNYELIIKPTEGNQTSFYSIKETGGKIGRHSSNQILILEESISRYHAEIIFKDHEFYLKDVGSTTGTFIKIDGKIKLRVGLMIELGSNQFEVERLVITGNTAEVRKKLFLFFSSNLKVVIGIFEGLNVSNKYPIKFGPQKLTYSIGRKPSADISFSDDHHLSNIHAKILLIDNEIYLEDMGSTNGYQQINLKLFIQNSSWLRLSKEGEASEPHLLNEETSFKIGTTSTYICQKQYGIVKQKFNPDCCIICCENDRDALYMPCKHNAACLKCSKNFKECPICRYKIEDIIRIYKN